MLPFLNKKTQQAGLIVKERAPDADKAENPEENQELKACAKDLIDAVHSHNVQGVMDALYAAYSHMEADPHDGGGEEPSPHSYAAQNIKAAK